MFTLVTWHLLNSGYCTLASSHLMCKWEVFICPLQKGNFPLQLRIARRHILISFALWGMQTVGAITEMVQGRLKPFFMQIGQVFESFPRWKKTNSSKNPDKTEFLLIFSFHFFGSFWVTHHNPWIELQRHRWRFRARHQRTKNSCTTALGTCLWRWGRLVEAGKRWVNMGNHGEMCGKMRKLGKYGEIVGKYRKLWENMGNTWQCIENGPLKKKMVYPLN